MSALPPWSGGVRTAKKRCWSDDVRGHRPPRMGGIILLESEVDQGTTFHFTAQFGLSSSSMWEGPERPDLRAGDRGTEAHPTLSTMRILIAEDNAINRAVATGILAKRGHTLVHAENGREAAEAFARASFHVVLMDIQMPEMDGYEATRRIRRMERATGRRTAIVAMTAHAMTGDRERCLAAGMDDYISKPLRGEELQRVLDGIQAVTPSEKLNAKQTSVHTHAELLEQYDGDENLVGELITLFRDDTPKLLEVVRRAAGRHDAPGLMAGAHKLLSSLGAFGAANARLMVLEIEEQGRQANFECATERIGQLAAEMEKIHITLACYGFSSVSATMPGIPEILATPDHVAA